MKMNSIWDLFIFILLFVAAYWTKLTCILEKHRDLLCIEPSHLGEKHVKLKYVLNGFGSECQK